MTVAVCHVMPAQQQLDMWSAIQAPADDDCATKPEMPAVKAKAGYPMATVRRSMSQESLSLCTESLGCETGTCCDFLDLASLLHDAPPTSHTTDDAVDFFSPPAFQDEEEAAETEGELTLREVHYHRARPQRAFPPPLPSMTRRHGSDGGPCLRVRPRRRYGRLVLEAVAVKPQGYLHAQREGGRLKLCFVDCSSASASVRDHHDKQSMVQPQHEHHDKQSMVQPQHEHHDKQSMVQPQHEHHDKQSMVQPQHEHHDKQSMVQPQHEHHDKQSMVQPQHEHHDKQSMVQPQHEHHDKHTMVQPAQHEEEEEEDEVEVVDRGTVVEVVAASGKAQRCSRIVINKFVSGPPATCRDASRSRCCGTTEDELAAPTVTPWLRRVPSSTTTLAAAVAAASTGMQPDEEDEEEVEEEDKEKSTALLFTSRVGERMELLQSVRRCRQLRQRPLFIVEPYSISAA